MSAIRNIAIVTLGGLFAFGARADVLGSNPFTQLPTLDTCSGCLFVYIQFNGSNAGQTVTSYQFYNGAGASTPNEITPLLFEKTGAQTFDIIGIGATSSGFSAGYNSEVFTPVSGSAVVQDSNTYFGYVDGDSSGGHNTGTITSNFPTGPGANGFFHPALASFGVGFSDTFSTWANVGQNQRTYSLQVTTPEPGFYICIVLSVIALGFKIRSGAIKLF